MKVVLLKNIKGTGMAGEIKEVNDGHAFNYLIPNKLARPAKQSDLNRKSSKSYSQQNLEKRKKKLSKQAGAVEGVILDLKVKADDSGKLFGSVNAKTIAAELKKKGLDVDEKHIASDPIKELGQHKVTVNFGESGKAILTVNVSKE